MGPVRIVSAYTCNTGGLVCDPTNGNVIDTFVIPNDSTGTPMCADYIGTHSVGCAYVVAGGGGATYLTINITNGDPQGQGNNHWFPSMTEAESSTKAQTFDAAGAAKSSEGTSQSGVSLALSGSSDFIFQAIDAGPSESQITPSSNCSGQAYTGLFDDHYAAAYALNTSCGASPTWTWTGYPDSGVVTAVAFKE